MLVHSATQWILGIQPEYDGLRLRPCLPRAWHTITVPRRFRGRAFPIRIRNGETGVGMRRLVVNGAELAGDMVPASAFEDTSEVTVDLA